VKRIEVMVAKNIVEEIENKKVEDILATVDDDVKKEYMTRIWNMTKAEIFHELMRVHGESAKIINEAYDNIATLQNLINNQSH